MQSPPTRLRTLIDRAEARECRSSRPWIPRAGERLPTAFLIALLTLATTLGAATAVKAAGQASVVSAASAAVAGLPPLRASVLDALASSGLIGGAGDRVAAFAWTLESTRPLRSPRWQHERFSGTPPGVPAGLSPIWRQYLPGDPREAQTAAPGPIGADQAAAAGPADGYSARGLMIVRPDDAELPVRIAGLVLPLVAGAQFGMSYDEDGASLSQTCTVGASAPAASIHPGLPGEAQSVTCAGRGSYRGIPVRGGASVVYLPRLGVFLNVEQHIDSPFGKLRWSTRVLSFEPAAP